MTSASGLASECACACARVRETPSDVAAVEILVDLVGTASVSGDERGAVERFVRHGTAFGLEAEIDGAGSGVARRAPRIANRLAGAMESGGAIEIVLLGHIDTVPGEIPVRIEDGVLHGRGSVDAKGPLCAMLVAAARAELPSHVGLTVVGAVGEETPRSPGARHVAARMRPDACIIGEPSGWDGVTLGYKGRLIVRAETARPSAHSAGPDPSAADTLHGWWGRVLALVGELSQADASPFECVQATIQSWESAEDAHTDGGSLAAGFRLPPAITPDALEERISAITPESIRVSFSSREAACCTTRTDPVVRALSVAIRKEGGAARHKRKTGTADLNVVAPIWGCPIAAYGPGDSSLDHTPEERIEIEEYLRSIRVLTRAIESLAGELGAESRE